jgi:hypothetical protein
VDVDPASDQRKETAMEKRFTVLRVMGNIWKIIAWVELVVGVIVSIALLVIGSNIGGSLARALPTATVPFKSYGTTAGVVGFVASLVMTIVYFLLMYGLGEMLYLLIGIEENTRQTATQVQSLAEKASG